MNGIWSIMATIRWCPIFPKWDIYQPLLRNQSVNHSKRFAENTPENTPVDDLPLQSSVGRPAGPFFPAPIKRTVPPVVPPWMLIPEESFFNIPSGWWFGICFFIFPSYWEWKIWKIIPTDELTPWFFRGRSTTNQPWLSPKNPKKNPLICHPADGWVVGDVQP